MIERILRWCRSITDQEWMWAWFIVSMVLAVGLILVVLL